MSEQMSAFSKTVNYSFNMWSNAYTGHVDSHLVPDAQGEDVGPWTVFERVGRLVRQGLLDGVGVVVRPGQKPVPLSYAQTVGFPARAFEPVRLPHWVQFSLFDEVADVIETRDGRVLEECERRGVWGMCDHVAWCSDRHFTGSMS